MKQGNKFVYKLVCKTAIYTQLKKFVDSIVSIITHHLRVYRACLHTSRDVQRRRRVTPGGARHQARDGPHGRLPGAQAGQRLRRSAGGVRHRKAANVAPTRNVARD
eukprot:2315849-Pleurochrysis_carterae.AAC.1